MPFTPVTPQFQRGYNFQTKEFGITNTKLHSMIDSGYLLPNSITGFQVFPNSLTGNEQLLIVSSGVLYNITTQTLANLAAAASIPNNSITNAKMVVNTLLGGGGGSIALDTLTGGTGSGVGNIGGGTIHAYNVANDLNHNNFAANEIMIGVGPLDVYNPIINGGFGLDQRNVGAAVAITTSTKYICDKWYVAPSATLTAALSCKQQTTTVPAGVNNTLQAPIGALQVQVTTAQASLAAGDFLLVAQKVEGYYVQPLINQPISVSFWFQSPVTGTLCLSLANSAQNESIVFNIPITVTGSFQRYTILNIPILPTGSGTWNFTTGIGLFAFFCFGAGSTFQAGSAGVWSAGNFVATSSQTNFLSALQTFYLSAVKIEPNPVVTPYVYKGWNQELIDSKRYFRKSWDLGTSVGSAVNQGALQCLTLSTANGNLFPNVQYDVEMRIAGAPVYYSNATGAINRLRDNSSSTDLVFSSQTNSTRGIGSVAATANFSASGLGFFQYVNDVDL